MKLAKCLATLFFFSTFSLNAAVPGPATQSAKSCARGQIYDAVKMKCCTPSSKTQTSC
ncbi:hypothetical protein [Legionella sp. km772]|uniref:hypothetical protein n=1 Tax=Legionella sp. km772 TaxID=2498111 RepID=UPI00131520A4|nr:hypothetical protein [Legionella sp. km772]